MTLTIGQRVAALRKDTVLDQRDAAALGGLSQTTWSRIERGDKEANLGDIVGIAHALGCLISTVTGHSALGDRLTSAARTSTADADIEPVMERLRFYMELDAELGEVGTGEHRVS